MAERMEHPTGLPCASGMLRESTVCAENPSEEKITSYSKREAFV